MEQTTPQPNEDRFASCLNEYVIPASEPPLSGSLQTISTSESAQAYRRLLLLYDLGRQVFAKMDEESVFRAILSAASSLLSAERALIAIVSGGRLVARATRGMDLPDDSESWPISKTMLHRVLSEGVSILTTDARGDAQDGGGGGGGLHTR